VDKDRIGTKLLLGTAGQHLGQRLTIIGWRILRTEHDFLDHRFQRSPLHQWCFINCAAVILVLVAVGQNEIR
jgi:hypothetical protein